MSVDLRTRRDGDLPAVVPSDFFSTDLPAALERSHGLVTAGAARLRLRPLTIHCGDESWSLDRGAETIRVRRGPAPGGARLVLSIEDLTALVHDQCTPMTFYVAGRLDMSAGGLPDFLDWWLVLRAALDRRALYVPGTVDFKDGDGGPLDLRRSFLPDDAGDEMSHFLHQAGFLHVRGVFDAGEMARISADMDRAAPRYRDGDGRSWWATVADGSRRLVRLQGFDEYSETTAGLLADERLLRLGDIPGDGHLHTGLENNRIEALVEGFGYAVAEGMASRLPVVASNASSLPEIVDDGSTGFLVDPHDEVALDRAVRTLLGDPELRRRFGEAGRASVARRFGATSRLDDVERLFADELRARGGRPASSD
jgi:glycosyltransferase involved in cell wall biosynthesis